MGLDVTPPQSTSHEFPRLGRQQLPKNIGLNNISLDTHRGSSKTINKRMMDEYIMNLAECYEATLESTKSSRRSGMTGVRTKYETRIRRTKSQEDECRKEQKLSKSKSKERRPLSRRQENRDQQTRDMQERGVVPAGSQQSDDFFDDDYNLAIAIVNSLEDQIYYEDDEQIYYEDDNSVVSATELGVDEEAYDRLLQILNGDEISPEDYDTLLRLDTNNTKSTLDVSTLSEYEVIVVDETTKTSFGDANCCLICLQSLFDVIGKELRRLPCQHVFCKECIDDWLTSNSTKCPNLACFWTTSKT